MKFKTSALAMTATVAVGLMSSAFAAETSYDKLGFSTNQTYSVTVSDSTITTSEGSTLLPTPTAQNGAIEIDSDETDRLTFTPAPTNAVNDATELKFKVEASVVPNSVALAIDTNAQCGFAIKDTDGTTNFWVYTSEGWTSVSGTVPAPGSMFDLTVKIDYRTGFAQAKYLVGSTDLGWHALKGTPKKVSYIDFIGNGKLASLRGDVLQVASEVIKINPTGSKEVDVKFTEEQLNKLRTALGGTTDDVVTKLNSTNPQNNTQKPFDNYILYGKIKDDDISASTVPVVKADPAAVPQETNNVIVKVPTLDVQFVEGVTVTHQLRGSNDCSSWTNVGSAITSTKEKPNPSFEIGAGTGYKFYQVVTTVSTAKSAE